MSSNKQLTFEDKVIKECVGRIDKHIIELLEIKNIIEKGIETQEKLSKFWKKYYEICGNHNNLEQVKCIIQEYNTVFDIIKDKN